MHILIFFAFLAGVVTILSPCILPVLPIILSSSTISGKRQPFGVLVGFIVSFTFFTLFLTTIVQLTGISANFLRNISMVVILVFGLVLVVPKLQLLFEIFASKMSSKVQVKQNAEGGFVSGLVLGVSLGLIWTPCVGPILASVIALALTGSVSGQAFFITLAYALGTSIPMVAIIYGGRGLIARVPWLTMNLGKIQKVFGVLMILTALAIFFNFDRQFQNYVLEKFPNYGTGLTKLEDNQLVKDTLEDMMGNKKEKVEGEVEYAPELIPGGEWLNSQPLTLEQLKGKVVLIDFWTYTCINCIRTLPYVESWYEKYKDSGLVVIGVHTPEFEFEKDVGNLQKAISDFELTYPVMQDNDYSTWRAYNNHYWPAKYFIDAEGVLRDMHFGEGDYDESEQIIRDLLVEAGYSLDGGEVSNLDYSVYSNTPETYIGYERVDGLVSNEKIAKDTKSVYTAPDKLGYNDFALVGEWNIGKERAMPFEGSSLIFNFDSKEVFLVMRPKGDIAGQLKVYLDDEVVSDGAGSDVENGIINVDTDRLYKLIKLDKPGKHLLKLEFLDENVEVYAFTFG